MIRRPPRSTLDRSSAASDVYKRQAYTFLLVGYALSVGIGLYIGWHTQDFFADITLLFRDRVAVVQSGMLAYTWAAILIPDLIVYPPIAVLIVDTVPVSYTHLRAHETPEHL